jgi:hypothetical protein
MKTLTIRVSPRMAAKWLMKNKNNRPLSQTRVDYYCDMLLNKKWMITGEAIKFDWDGNLLDGQHRLAACVKSKASFKTVVIRGLDPNSFMFMDETMPRGNAHRLHCAHEKNSAVLGTAINRAIVVDRGGIGKRKIRPDEVFSFLNDNPKIRDSASLSKSMEKKTTAVKPATFTALHYLFSKAGPEINNTFWERVAEGIGLKRGMPEMVLRSRLLKDSASQAKLREIVIMALIIKTWNSVVLGKPLKGLQWRDGEPFPKIVKAARSLKVAG